MRWSIRWLFAVVCLAIVLVPMDSQADEPSSPTQAQHGEDGAMFSQVDPRTGAMTYAFTFELPSARGLDGPTLAVRYNSSMGDGNVAYGWSLGIPTIERRPLSGLPRSTSTGEPIGGDRYTFDGQPLVKLCVIGGACPEEPFTSGHPTWADGWSYFRLQNEGLFARFYMSPTRTTFRAVFKGGDMVEFGLPHAAGGFAMFGLDTNVVQWTENWDNGITRWLPSIRRSLNHPNNVIAYRWSQLGSRGIAYLTDIWDTPPSAGAASPAEFEHHTQLSWSPVPDPGFSHAPPFRARPDFRLDRVGVASMPWSGTGPREVYRVYSLSYGAPRGSRPGAGWPAGTDLAPLWQHTFLKQISQMGHCIGNVEDANGGIPGAIQCASLPPVTFEYEAAIPTPFDSYAPELESGPPDLVANNSVLPRPVNAGVFDFDRDGRPDIVQSWPEWCDNGRKRTVMRDIAGSFVLVCRDVEDPENDQILRSSRPMLAYRNVGPTIGAPAGHTFGYRCMDAGPTTDPHSLSSAQGPHGPPFGDRGPGFFAENGNTTLGAFGSGGAIWGQNAYFPVVARFVQTAPVGAEPGASGCHLNASFDPQAFHPSWRWQTMAVEPWQKRVPRDVWESSVPEWNVDIDGDGYPDRLTRHPGPALGVYARATPTFTRRFAAGEAYPLPPSASGTGTGPALVPFAFSFPPVANSIVPIEPYEVWDPALNGDNHQRVYYTDVNGDGFPDAVSRDYWLPVNQPIRVRPGDGKGNFRCLGTDPWPCTEEMLGAESISSYYELDIVAPHMPWDLPPGVLAPSYGLFFEMADVTGDGLSDIVRVAKDGARMRVEVWTNLDGHRFECVGAPADPCLAGYFNIDVNIDVNLPWATDDHPRLTFADMDSDGVNDIVYLTQKGAFVGKFNAAPVQGAAGERAVRPAQLVRVDNGRGVKTEVKYRTVQELEKEAADAGNPWLHRSPVVESVVTETRTHNDPPGGGTMPAPFAVDRYVRFSYREPGYDNWARRFVGFRKVGVRTGFDQAITETTYWLGPCENGDTPEESTPAFCPETSDDEQPSSPSYRAWVGKPMRVDRYVPAVPLQGAPARYLWSRRFEYDPPQTLFGPSAAHPEIDRHVTFTFAKRVETHLYAPEQEVAPPYSHPTLFGGDDIEHAPGQVGHRIVASTVRIDTNGTIVEQTSLGEEAALDYARVTQYSTVPYGAPPEVTCDANWNCLATNVTVFSQLGGTGPVEVHRKQRLTFDASADLRKVEADLAADQVLDRYHPSGPGSYSESAPGAALAGWKTQSESDYSADGVLVLAKGPGEGTPHRTCARTTLDDEYGHFPKRVDAFTAVCDSGAALMTQISFDRDFGVPVTITAPDLGVSMTVLDPFGRVQETYAPDPDALVGTPRIVADATYSDFGSAAWVETRQYTTSITYIRSVGVLNALLEPVMGFQQADGSDWTVHGWTQRDAAGRAIKTYRGFGAPATSLAAALAGASVPLPTYGAYEPILDAFGRSVGTRENGVQIAERKLSPLAMEVRDQEQLPGGGHTGAFTRVETNGHGEVVHVAQHGDGDVVDTWNTLDGMGQTLIIDRTGPGAGPYARSLVWDSFGRIVENAERNAMDRVSGRTIHYAFDDNNRLAGTSDGRGCGEDLYYDALGRLVGVNYSPCTTSQPEYTAYYPFATPNGLEAEYRYDAYDPAQVNPEPGFGDDPGLAAGRLTARIDRGSETHFNYDARGRTRRVSRKIAKPLSQQAPGQDPYAPHWFRQRIDFDVADRLSARTTGVEEGDLLAGGAGAETYAYSSRGLLQSVWSATRPVISGVTYYPEGMLNQVTYGDLAQTKSKRIYDPQRQRLTSYTVARLAPFLWITPSANYSVPGADTKQTTLADFGYHYDLVGNPDEINDLTPIAGFNEDAWPVHQRRIWNDDFYRVTRIEYGYGSPTGSAFYRSPFRPETQAGDTRPVSRASLDTRVAMQLFSYDFMGNTIASSDDLSATYDRSLGNIANGDGTGWGPNQLTATTGDGVTARYDEAGNLVELKVTRPGSCPSGAGSHCAQWYAYEWDEVGQLSRARRWDFPTTLPTPAGNEPEETSAWDLRYAYSGGVRVLKSSKDALEVERHTLDVFDTLRFERDEYLPGIGDYERHRTTTHVYLAGGTGHVFYDDTLPAPPNTSPARMYLNIGDHLGSTSVVIDHTTSELVERATFMAYGAIEADHRPARWSHAREPFKFTGKEEDIEVGAIYFGARYYNAHLGRFLSPDPLTIHAFTSDTNPYAYVRGRVMKDVDPLGLCSAGDGQACIGGAYWPDAAGNQAQRVSVNDEWIPQQGTGGLISHMHRDSMAPRHDAGGGFPSGPELGGGMFWEAPAPELRRYGTQGNDAVSAGGIPTVTSPIERWHSSRSDYLSEEHPLLAPSIQGAAREDAFVKVVAPALVTALTATPAVGIDVAADGAATAAGRGGGGIGGAPGGGGGGGGGGLPTVTFDAATHPQLAENIAHAQAAGHPSVLTYNGGGAASVANRSAATSGIPRFPGTSIDEYPFASTVEGGADAWVGHVPVSQQNAQGAILRNFYAAEGIKAGDSYVVRVINFR